MKEEAYWILKSPNKMSEELIFDDKEMSIQRDLRLPCINIITSLLMIISLGGTIFTSYHHGNRIIFYVCVLSFFIGIYLFSMGTYMYYKARKKNKHVYPIHEIKLVRSIIKNKIVGIVFEFKDGTKDRVSIAKTEYYDLLIAILKKNSIETIENNKR